MHFVRGSHALWIHWSSLKKLTSTWMREFLFDFQKVLNKIQILCRQMWTDAYSRRIILIFINCILSWSFHLATNSSHFDGTSSSLLASSRKVHGLQFSPQESLQQEKEIVQIIVIPLFKSVLHVCLENYAFLIFLILTGILKKQERYPEGLHRQSKTEMSFGTKNN